jgi:hypothetical protein
MAERLDVLIASKWKTSSGEERTRYQRVGAAFSTKNGGWSVKFDAPTVIVPGMADLVMFPPKPKDDRGGGYEQQGGGSDGGQDIPFMPAGND